MIPSGPDPKPSFTLGFFETAAAQNPKPTTVALVAADAEFANNACEGARKNAEKFGFKIVYDRRYPPPTTDFAPIVRAIQAANPDIVAICSYPLNSVGMVRAVNELNYKPKMIGGAMVGLQATVFKNQLGPLLNGWVNYETWVPTKSMMFEGTEDFFKKYQSRAQAEGVDPLGYYLGGWGHAYISVLGDAIKATNSLDDNKLADYIKQDQVQDHPRPHQVRPGRRVGGVRHAAGAVSRHQAGRRHRGVARHGSPDRADAGQIQVRHRDLPLRKGEVSAKRSPIFREEGAARETVRRFSLALTPRSERARRARRGGRGARPSFETPLRRASSG